MLKSELEIGGFQLLHNRPPHHFVARAVRRRILLGNLTPQSKLSGIRQVLRYTYPDVSKIAVAEPGKGTWTPDRKLLHSDLRIGWRGSLGVYFIVEAFQA